MIILTWNIQSGGGNRLPLIIRKILKVNPTIAVLTEFRANKISQELITKLGHYYPYYTRAESDLPKINSVAIFSKKKITIIPCRIPKKDRHRFIRISVNGLKIIGAYFAQKMEKKSQFNYLIRDAQRHGTENTIIIGDLNTGHSDIDSANVNMGFHCENDFVKLATELYADAYRYKNGQKKVYSWWSRKDYGYRIDHCLCDTALLKNIKKCYYIKRDKRASDHTPLVVEL